MTAAFAIAIVAITVLMTLLLAVLRTELDRAVARKAAIQDAALDAIVTVDVNGRIVEYNPAAFALFGIPAARAIGCDAIELLVPPQDRERVRTELAAHAATPADSWRDRLRAYLLRADGETFPAEIAITRVQAQTETLFTGFVRDISIEVNAEAERRHSREMLELQVFERTADLIEANEQVRQSLREKEVLLGEIHHRVKNNLQVISSLLHLQVERLPSAAARHALAESQSRIQSMALVHQLLYRSKDFSHIEFLDYLQTVVDSLIRSYRTEATNVEAVVKGDRLQLDIDRAITCGLIVTELVTNALRHAFADRTIGHLAVSLAAREGDVVLEVRDDGTGIPQKAVESTSTFGLQIARTLTQQLAGDLDIASDNGTIIQIRFPLAMRVAA
ncbi:MAG TPA: histidine kinase dimerization/phosphoacceptor domain -containing protein [Kofleriaceae bacterium]|nr:histidine kinase dimerization/phosphoacceptor domain -containing protein [Kofleriaceae bacterium]